MRWFPLLWWMLLGACTAPQTQPAERASLPEGEGVYEIRYNPPGCLAAQRQLHLELRAAGGVWERVYAEPDEDDPGGFERLLSAFATAPKSIRTIAGRLTGRTQDWAGRHNSRVFVLSPIQSP